MAQADTAFECIDARFAVRCSDKVLSSTLPIIHPHAYCTVYPDKDWLPDQETLIHPKQFGFTRGGKRFGLT